MSISGEPDGARGGSAGYVNDAGAEAYAKARHGVDGAALLDPIFQEYMRDLCPDNEVIDIGCGAAPWAIYAVKNCGAAAVRGYDSSTQMLAQAGQALTEAGIDGEITLNYGTAKDLPIESATSTVALSLNVGCALPTRAEDDRQDGGILAEHFSEIERVLDYGGVAVVTAPVSLETPFTTHGSEDAKLAAFDEALRDAENIEDVRRVVGLNGDVLRATIIESGGTFRIAKPEEVWMGRGVLRKIPGLVVPNYAHDEAEYETAITAAGLHIVARKTPTLADGVEAEKLGLGRQYIDHNPFAIYMLRKTA
jgi:SAM-dependent methyltransferase